MNKHKEALQKIIEVTLDQSTANKIATEALQSESRMYSEDELEIMYEAGQEDCGEFGNILGFKRMLEEKLSILSLQPTEPKKEEQTYGEWMRSNPEQPTSPSIEKMAEERYPKNYVTFPNFGRNVNQTGSYSRQVDVNEDKRNAFMEGYKATLNQK